MATNGPKDRESGAVTLAELAKHLNLTKGTVSAVLNDSPYAKSIPKHTKDRIIAAASELNYRPNFFASTLRKKRTFTVGVIAEEIGDPYGSILISGIESALSQRHYFFLTVIHRHDPKLLKQYSDILRARGVEGVITVDTILDQEPALPTVAIAGHHSLSGVTNIALDHKKAADLAVGHLFELGHREIAIIRGQPFSTDSQRRWEAICETAEKIGIEIKPELTTELTDDDPSPLPGYRAAKELLSRGVDFTALFAYNDISCIGAIRAIRERGLRVPEDISVIGFDDIREAAYQYPGITTVRQPLREMGELAGHTIVDRIEGRKDCPSEIAIEPELVVRESTAPPRTQPVRAVARQ
jgi:DNA-binding LacI/PurR family transcriptional regulator